MSLEFFGTDAATDQGVNVGTSTDFGLGTAFTFFACIRTDLTNAQRMIFAKDEIGQRQFIFSVYPTGGGDPPKAGVELVFFWAGASYMRIYSADVVPAATWTNVCITRNGVAGQVYLNGVAASTSIYNANAGAMVVGTGDAQIGRRLYAGYIYGFDGMIANVAIWNRALSINEIETLGKSWAYNIDRVAGRNLVRWWPLNDLYEGVAASGTEVIIDRTFKNPGTCVGTPMPDGAADFLSYPLMAR